MTKGSSHPPHRKYFNMTPELMSAQEVSELVDRGLSSKEFLRHPVAETYHLMRLTYKMKVKKIRPYAERIQNVDHSSFILLIFTTSERMDFKEEIFYSRLTEVMEEKK